MFRQVAKLLALSACMVSVGGACAAPTQAGVIPCVWNFLFGGCCRGGCGARGGCGNGCYGGAPMGCYSGGCGTYAAPMGGCPGGACGTSFYGPMTYMGYSGGSCGTGCSSYGSCGNCGMSGCSSGSCCGDSMNMACGPTGCDSGCSTGIPAGSAPAASPSPPLPRPAPYTENGPQPLPRQKTFDENPIGNPANSQNVPPAVTKPDAGFEPAAKPIPKPSPMDDDGDFRPARPATGTTTTPPAKSTEEDGLSKPRTNTLEKPAIPSPATPAIREDEKSSLDIQPLLKLDDKITWRAAPVRSIRREIPQHVANARLVRIPAFPSNDWIPLVDTKSIAKK